MNHLYFIVDTSHPKQVKVTSESAVEFKGELYAVFEYKFKDQQFFPIHSDPRAGIQQIVSDILGLNVSRMGNWLNKEDETFFHLKFNDLQDYPIYVDLPENS